MKKFLNLKESGVVLNLEKIQFVLYLEDSATVYLEDGAAVGLDVEKDVRRLMEVLDEYQ